MLSGGVSLRYNDNFFESPASDDANEDEASDHDFAALIIGQKHEFGQEHISNHTVFLR